MTPLHKEIARITDILHRGKLLVIKIAPEGLYIKGARERWSTAYLVPWQATYDLGAKMKAAVIREEKRLKRKFR